MGRQLYFAGVLIFAGFLAFAVEPVISADRADCLYATGERVVFTVRGDASLGSVNIWIDDGGTTVVARTVCDFAVTNVCELSAMRDTPGALRLRVVGPKCKKSLYGVWLDGREKSVPTFVAGRIVVSDTNRFTCGSGSVSCLSPDGKRILAPYLASTTGFGECHDLTAIADIPCAHPEKARSFVVLKAGDQFCGTTVTTTVNYASVLLNGRVRVMVDVNFDTFGFRDWDPVTRKVAGEGLFKCCFSGRTERLSPEAISTYLAQKGLTGFNPLKERGDRCVWQSRPAWKDGVFFGFVTSSCSHPILFRCADGMTFEFLGAIPTVAEYECQLAIHKGIFYAVMRGAKGDNFWASTDDGRTWKASGRVPDGLQRPQMLVWRDKVLIGYSAPDEKPCNVRNGRNNLYLIWGEGLDLSAYRELLHVVDPIGIVYPDLVDVNGKLHVLWSNSERFPTHIKWGAVQGKDQILHSVLDF